MAIAPAERLDLKRHEPSKFEGRASSSAGASVWSAHSGEGWGGSEQHERIRACHRCPGGQSVGVSKKPMRCGITCVRTSLWRRCRFCVQAGTAARCRSRAPARGATRREAPAIASAPERRRSGVGKAVGGLRTSTNGWRQRPLAHQSAAESDL